MSWYNKTSHAFKFIWNHLPPYPLSPFLSGEVFCLFFPFLPLLSMLLLWNAPSFCKLSFPSFKQVLNSHDFLHKTLNKSIQKSSQMIFSLPDEVTGRVMAVLWLVTCHWNGCPLMPQTNKFTTSTCNFRSILLTGVIYIFVDILKFIYLLTLLTLFLFFKSN